MHLQLILAVLPYFAALTSGASHEDMNRHCLDDPEAKAFVDSFDAISEQRPGWERIARRKYAPNFQFISEGLIFLKQGILNTPAANSLQEYLDTYVKGLPPSDPSSDEIYLLEHSCQTITVYKQFYVDETPVRGIQIHFIELDKRQVIKMIWEFNNAAARYAICKAGSPACPLQFNFTIGDNGPAHETANCQGLKSLD